ncbi:MAG: DUF2027 domain-containing protein [Prolixibacteraceae bacterium]|jgi:hypothetical protein|nr:DUF2027 domain-containing protein [Prolixibacteraceae bacterium]NLO03805.1 DUF2027 domain-containing protein [Bacteroidales bacterium]
MIKIGDKVKFLDDVGGGIVKGFTGKNMANVENEDGFEIPYPVSMLINVDDPEFTGTKKNRVEAKDDQVMKQVQEELPQGRISEGKDSPDFYFCFVPSDPKNPLAGDIELFFVNDSNFSLLIRYAHYKNETYTTFFYGIIPSNSKKLLESIGQNDLGELPDYIFQVIYFRDNENEFRMPFYQKIRITPVKFYKEKSYQANRFFDREAIMIKVTENIMQSELDKLSEDDFRKVFRNKEVKSEKKQIPVIKTPEIIEVDLHINELIDNSSGLSNKEMLDIQIDKVEREMRSATGSRAKRIVFIHGVGQGVLKQEIAKLLKSKFSKYSYHDASFKEYGYGATMVILRKG